MAVITNLLNIFFQSLNLILTDKVFRKMIYRPLLGGLKISLYFTLGWILLSYFSCQYGADYLTSGSSYLFAAGNFVVFIVLLPLVVFLYFSFFCEGPYQDIARYGLWLNGLSNNDVATTADGELALVQVDRNPFASVLQVVFFLFLLVASIISSFFFPPIGLLFAGLILVWDFASYSFNELKVGYLKRVNFIYDNFMLSIFLSFLFGAIVLIPFIILVFYPVGVFMAARFVRISGEFAKVSGSNSDGNC